MHRMRHHINRPKKKLESTRTSNKDRIRNKTFGVNKVLDIQFHNIAADIARIYLDGTSFKSFNKAFIVIAIT